MHTGHRSVTTVGVRLVKTVVTLREQAIEAFFGRYEAVEMKVLRSFAAVMKRDFTEIRVLFAFIVSSIGGMRIIEIRRVRRVGLG